MILSSIPQLIIGKFLGYHGWVEDLLPSYYGFLVIFLVFEVYCSNDDDNDLQV